MIPINQMTDAELAAYVSSHLRSTGIDVVLSGGACVSIHSHRKYVSMDLDLINVRFAGRRQIREAMAEIGFHEKNRYFVHPETEYLIEFPPGPLAVGEEPVRQVDELTFKTGTVRVLSPTDCIKDRLTWYYHSNDMQCLAQASFVAQAQKVSLEELERWSTAEGKTEEFKKIRSQLTVGANSPFG